MLQSTVETWLMTLIYIQQV